jgi:hypothetical protein
MAASKKPAAKKQMISKWNMSWKQWLIAASVALNIAFVVVVVTMMTTHALDGMFMKEGLARYCARANDAQFDGSTDKVKALRVYTCAGGDAKSYFDEGFQKYLDFKGVKN